MAAITQSCVIVRAVGKSRAKRPLMLSAMARSGVPQAATRICVLGAGVAGLTCAVQLQQLPGVQVTVVAELFDEHTTSYGAGGLWKPFKLGDTPADKVNRWGNDTFDHYMQLYMSPEAGEAGVILTSAYQLWKEQVPDPEWAEVVPHFRHLTPRELSLYDPTASHSHGWFYTTVITEGRYYLAWLMKQLRTLGGSTKCQKVASLEQLADYDVLVNCSGLGAQELFGDESVYAVRGQVIRVKAPWVRHYSNSNGNAYIIPNGDTVVLGGTMQPHDYDTAPREEDSQGILDRCSAIVPSLRAAEIERVWVGLRPCRREVRLESEMLQLSSRDAPLPVVHNYGHGGAGLTLAWGCAADVVVLVKSL